MKNNFKRLIILLLSISLVFILSCCEKYGDTIKVGTWKTSQTIQPFFYSEYMDTQLEILPFTNPGDQKTALLAGQLDMCGTTLVTAIMAASKGEPIVIVASMCNKCSALVVGLDSGINTEADLKGKRIGYVPGTMHHLLLLDVLSKNNISENDVTLVRVDFFDMAQALRDEKIDAFLSGEPYPSMAELNGFGKTLCYPYYDDEMGTINAALITTKDKISEKPELIHELVYAHIQATDYLNSNKDIWLERSLAFGYDNSVQQFSMNNIELCYKIDQDYVTKTKVLAQKMYDLGMITQIPDIDELFNCYFINYYEKNHKKN